MAFIKCSGGAGKLKETLLWENPNPTKQFAEQTITLNGNIFNYEYIKMHCEQTIGNGIIFIYYFKVSDLITDKGINMGGMKGTTGNYGVVRTMIFLSSGTQIKYLSGHGWNNSNNSVAVTQFIYGLK